MWIKATSRSTLTLKEGTKGSPNNIPQWQKYARVIKVYTAQGTTAMMGVWTCVPVTVPHHSELMPWPIFYNDHLKCYSTILPPVCSTKAIVLVCTTIYHTAGGTSTLDYDTLSMQYMPTLLCWTERIPPFFGSSRRNSTSQHSNSFSFFLGPKTLRAGVIQNSTTRWQQGVY